MMEDASEELQEAQEKYLLTQNRVNLLLVKEHKLRKEQLEFNQQLTEINNLLHMMQKNQNSSGRLNRAVLSEDLYLRKMIKDNSVKIKELQRKLAEGPELTEKSEKVALVHETYRKMLNGELEKKTRETLSTLRGRVEQLRKKTKQLTKQIQSLQESQKNYIDELSLQKQTLKEQESKIRVLKHEIRNKKQQLIANGSIA